MPRRPYMPRRVNGWLVRCGMMPANYARSALKIGLCW